MSKRVLRRALELLAGMGILAVVFPLVDSIYLKMDTVKPSVTITTPAKGAIYALNSIVYAAYSCSDASGVASCVGTTAVGAAIPTSSKGTQMFTVTSKDNAGNTDIKSVEYTVR
jgi:hypothetical protein